MIQYRTGGFSAGGQIIPVEVVREMTKQLIVLEEWNGKKHENRVAKMSEYHQYHYTWEEAHNYLVSKAEKSVEYAKRQYEYAQGQLEKIKNMTKPEAI